MLDTPECLEVEPPQKLQAPFCARNFNSKGNNGNTLKAGSGFFRGERYVVTATLDGETGTATLTPGMDGWYIGNILFGGLIGILIVDPATGAMREALIAVN